MSKQAQDKQQAAGEKQDFEASLAELEGLVEALESGELNLADSLERFKRGVELSKHCHEMLDQARQSVEILSRPEDESSARSLESADD